MKRTAMIYGLNNGQIFNSKQYGRQNNPSFGISFNKTVLPPQEIQEAIEQAQSQKGLIKFKKLFERAVGIYTEGLNHPQVTVRISPITDEVEVRSFSYRRKKAQNGQEIIRKYPPGKLIDMGLKQIARLAIKAEQSDNPLVKAFVNAEFTKRKLNELVKVKEYMNKNRERIKNNKL